MAYIGNPPISGNFQVCDAISVVNGQAAYTMQVSSANVSPESANHMLVSLNGVLQKPGSSFTISGSTITFASNLATGDVIDFILLLGNVNDIGTPSDATVTNAKTNFTTTSSAAGLQIKGDGTTAGALQLNCEQNSHGIKLQSPAHSANQSYTLKFPTGNVTAEKFLRVASVSGSGTTGIGQLDFADAGGGQKTLLHTIDASSSSSVEFNNTYITSAYRDYHFTWSNMRTGSDNTLMFMRVSDDNGSSFETNNYARNNFGLRVDTTTFSTNTNTGGSSFELTPANMGNASGENTSGFVTIFDMLGTNNHKLIIGRVQYHETNTYAHQNILGGSFMGSTSALNAVQFTVSTGNIASGRFKIFGIT
jgi:hypothetical protein